MNIELLYEVIEIIKKKENRIELTREENIKMNKLYDFYRKTDKHSMRFSKKGTSLYDLSLVQYLFNLIPPKELNNEDYHNINNFIGNQSLRFMMDIVLKVSEKEQLSRYELIKLKEIRKDLIRSKRIINVREFLKDKVITLRKPQATDVEPKRLFASRYSNAYVGGSYLEMFNALYKGYEPFLTEEEKFDFRLFKVLLDNKNKTARLSDLYKLTYKNVYSKEELERRIKDPKEMAIFFEKLNGCILEETVANININNIDPSDLSSVKIDYGNDIDPLVLVKTIKPVPLIKVDSNPDKEMTFVIFSDVHLDQNCYREENGEMVVDRTKLNRNLTAFAEFKKGLIQALGDINGIIYTGDILDGFFDRNKGKITLRTAAKLSGAIIRFEREAKETELMNKMFIEAGDTPVPEYKKSLSDKKESSFVAYLAGNHDMRLGRRKFERIMRLFERSILDPRAVSLGNGSARIKVGEEFISLMHHNSLDWGILQEGDKHTKQARNRASFRFPEYFEICKAIYGASGSEERTAFEDEYNEAKKIDPNIEKIYFLMKKVNDKMKKENPDLYYFYLPYITPNSDKIDYHDVVEDMKQFKSKKNMEFFRNFIVLDDNQELKIRERGVGNRLFPSADAYKVFIESEDKTTFTERLTTKVKELNDPKYRFDVIPQFGRNDAYTPKLTSLAHFHSTLSNEKKDGTGGRAKSHGKTKGNGATKKWYLNAAVQQDQGMMQKEKTGETRLTAMVYRLKFNEDKIAEIAVTPYKWRTNIKAPFVLDIKTGETITYKSR